MWSQNVTHRVTRHAALVLAGIGSQCNSLTTWGQLHIAVCKQANTHLSAEATVCIPTRLQENADSKHLLPPSYRQGDYYIAKRFLDKVAVSTSERNTCVICAPCLALQLALIPYARLAYGMLKHACDNLAAPGITFQNLPESLLFSSAKAASSHFDRPLLPLAPSPQNHLTPCPPALKITLTYRALLPPAPPPLCSAAHGEELPSGCGGHGPLSAGAAHPGDLGAQGLRQNIPTGAGLQEAGWVGGGKGGRVGGVAGEGERDRGGGK